MMGTKECVPNTVLVHIWNVNCMRDNSSCIKYPFLMQGSDSVGKYIKEKCRFGG